MVSLRDLIGVIAFSIQSASLLFGADLKPAPLEVTLPEAGSAMAFSPDGKILAVASNKISLWDIAKREKLCVVDFKLTGCGSCRHLVFSPDGKSLAAVYNGFLKDYPKQFILLWEVAPMHQLQNKRILLARKWELSDCAYPIYHVTFSPDGKTIVSGTADRFIHCWDVETGKERLKFPGGIAAGFSPDGGFLISVSHDGMVRQWDSVTGKASNIRGVHGKGFISVASVAFAPNGKMVALRDEHTLCLKDVATGNTVARLDFQGNRIYQMVFSEDSKTLAVYAGPHVRFLDANTAQDRSWTEVPEGRPGSFAISSDGQSLAVGNGQSILKVKGLPGVLAENKKPPKHAKTIPPDIPLQAELVAIKDTYKLDLGGRTAEEFSALVGTGRYPQPNPPQLDLIFRLRNTGDKKLTIETTNNHLRTLYLLGDGAINYIPGPSQLNLDPRNIPPLKEAILAPGETFSFPVKYLKESNNHYSTARYWILPGEYTLQASYNIWVSPPPKGTDALFGAGSVEVWCSPIKIKVIGN